MTNPLPIDLILLHGTPLGPKIASIKGWTGKAIYTPIQNRNEVFQRKEFDGPGVYIFKGPPPEENFFNEKIYIGRSTELRKRIKEQLRRNDFARFESFVAFSSTDDSLDLGTISYLEHKLISLGFKRNSAMFQNKQVPNPPPLSESSRIGMDLFLQNIEFLLPLLQFEFLTPSVLADEIPDQPTHVETEHRFELKESRITASMFIRDGQLIVTKGSQMSYDQSPSLSNGWEKIRRRLIEEKIAIQRGGHYELTKYFAFNSASAAASVLRGRQSAGPRRWIHTVSGKTYGQMLDEGIDF